MTSLQQVDFQMLFLRTSNLFFPFFEKKAVTRKGEFEGPRLLGRLLVDGVSGSKVIPAPRITN